MLYFYYNQYIDSRFSREWARASDTSAPTLTTTHVGDVSAPFPWLQARYRKEHAQHRSAPSLPLVENLLKDNTDGCALTTLLHYYCSQAIRLEGKLSQPSPPVGDPWVTPLISKKKNQRWKLNTFGSQWPNHTEYSLSAVWHKSPFISRCGIFEDIHAVEQGACLFSFWLWGVLCDDLNSRQQNWGGLKTVFWLVWLIVTLNRQDTAPPCDPRMTPIGGKASGQTCRKAHDT